MSIENPNNTTTKGLIEEARRQGSKPEAQNLKNQFADRLRDAIEGTSTPDGDGSSNNSPERAA